MKRFAALLLGLAPLAGCFPVRSEQFACTDSSQCASGRTCDTGFCVLLTEAVDGQPTDSTPTPSTMCEQMWPDATLLFDPCEIDEAGPELMLSNTGATGYILDTSGPTLTPPGGSSMAIKGSSVRGKMIVSTSKFTIAAGVIVHVIGATPLVIASWGDITIDGTLDAGSTTAQTGGVLDTEGPGAKSASGCVAGTAPTAGNGAGSGGGAGGSFGTVGGVGGAGGRSNNANEPQNGGGTGGALGTVHTVSSSELAAGCTGQPGASYNGTSLAGAGGLGGGGIALTAKGTLTISTSGKVAAGGAGGHFAAGQNNKDTRDGGGGGGSGGMIALEATTITVQGSLSANGGGGGQGRDNQANGTAGQNAGLAGTSVPGGNGNNNSGGFGGAGGSQPTAAKPGNNGVNGQGGQNEGGGGGGGGGVGIIVYHQYAGGSVTLPAITSPTATAR